MLSKQTLIHIATDVVLISILFMYVNNKNKACVSAIDELREYTEEQIDNINKKLDTLVRYVTKQKQRTIQQPQSYIQPQQQFQSFQQPQQQVPQPQPQQRTQYVPQQQVPQQPKQQRQEATRPVEKKVRFEDQEEPQQLREVDDFVQSMPPNIAFVATSFVQSSPSPKTQAAKIEVVEEESEENELNDMDIMEIEKALQSYEGDEDKD